MSTAGDIRALYIRKDTIWWGGNEFGFFVRSNGDYKFHSLGKSEAGPIWNIESLNDQIFFQSENQIILYHVDEAKIVTTLHPKIGAIAKWNDSIWMIYNNGQLGYLDGPEFVAVEVFEQLVSREVRKMFVHKNSLYFVLVNGEVYYYDGQIINQVLLPDQVKGNGFFTGMVGKDDKFFLGTISAGFLQVSLGDQQVKQINTNTGLLDDTVLSLKADNAGNMWLGLDYGIAKIELESPVSTVFEGAAVFDKINYHGVSYLATNKGLFASKSNQPFELIEASNGQVWKLKVINGEFYVCHNRGLFKVNNGSLAMVEGSTGFIDLAHFEGTEYYLLSTYDGLFLAKKEGSKILRLNNIELGGHHPKLFYDAENKCVWVVSEMNVHKIALNKFNEVAQEKFPTVHSVSDTNEGLLFSVEGKVQKYTDGRFQIADSPLLNSIEGPVKTLRFDKTGKALAYIQDGKVKLHLLLADGNVYAFDASLKVLSQDIIKGAEFMQIENSLLYIATDRGVKAFDFAYAHKKNSAPNLVISSLTLLNDTAQKYYYPHPKEGLRLSKGAKDIEFKFSIGKSAYDFIEYRYRLSPKENAWSPWYSDKDKVLYSQIKGGEYTFHLQSRSNGVNVRETTLHFSVDKLWYESSWVIVPVLLAVISWIFGVIIVMSRINRRKLKKQEDYFKQRNLEESLSMKNEQLLQYIEAISQKNEFLSRIKLSLEEISHPKARRWVNMISNELNSEKKEFLFHKLFSEVHQNFINRITKAFPTLTSNDIRMLSYIRINLSREEIANLMNISSKSVNMSKYRIKKKLDLDKDIDLGQFIREF